ncbi:MAG: proline--tRNA ligase [Erysipelotrichaceae bacterium]|nr:proline--tRNA ligase [Erysipelotrichaceae bacterium]
MKLKDSYFFTLREDVRDEDSTSGNLLVKAGYVKKTSAGVYMMLPLGLRVQNKIENIIRKHMNESGAQEVKMPAIIASEYYENSGRLSGFGPSIFKLKDRTGKDMVLGPTHEELFAFASKSMIRSYKDMPFNLYQFQTKFRDEPRARFGLIRVKEFVMKDAYSFDRDEAGLDVSYQKMFDAYKKSFDEMGINYRIVRADTGIMGGLLSEEFQAITPVGEDSVIYCDCGYSSNIEVAANVGIDETAEAELNMKEVATPHAETIEEVSAFLGKDPKKTVKALLMNVNDELVVFFIRGDRDLNENKVCKLLGCSEVNFADDSLIATSNAVPGFTGPVGLNAKIVVDSEVLKMRNFVCGANKEGYHLINVNPKDFKYDITGDIVNVKDGDVCPVCGQPLKFTKGIEVGNTFKLGTKYSKALDLKFLNSENKEELVWMGSYGIGIGRTMAAIVEQNNDEKGIIWPLNIAPYHASILIMVTKDETQCQVANDLYKTLNANGVEAMLDDRNERPGIKFNDSELIGIPYRITVGKKAAEGIVELKRRGSDEVKEMTIAEVVEFLKNEVNK